MLVLAGSLGSCPGSSHAGWGSGPAAFPETFAGAPLLIPVGLAPWPPCNIPTFLLPPFITQHPLKPNIPPAHRAKGVCCCPLQSPTSPSVLRKRYLVPSEGLGKGQHSPGSSFHCLCSTPGPGLICIAPCYVKINLGAIQKLGEGEGAGSHLQPTAEPSRACRCDARGALGD